MRPIPELAKMFDYGAQLYGGLYRAQSPTPMSVTKISAALGIVLPSELIEFAKLCPAYGAWFASLGEDFDSEMHILRLNEIFHDQREADYLPTWLVMFNHGHDGDCDCFDTRARDEKGDYPLVYYSVSESSNPPTVAPPVVLAASFHEYLETWAIRMKSDFDRYQKRKRRSTRRSTECR